MQLSLLSADISKPSQYLTHAFASMKFMGNYETQNILNTFGYFTKTPYCFFRNLNDTKEFFGFGNGFSDSTRNRPNRRVFVGTTELHAERKSLFIIKIASIKMKYGKEKMYGN